MKNNKLYWVLGGVCAVSFLAHLCFYPSLPETIPTHWGFDGTVDGWGPKYTVLILALLPALIALMLRVLPAMDPKGKNYETFSKFYNGFAIGITVFLVCISWLPELALFGLLPDGSQILGIVLNAVLGISFIALGNYMPRIKQNYFFGCRTPWGLADEHNWNRTNRMGGITFVVMGIILLASIPFFGLLGSFGSGMLILVAALGGSAWIYIYSFLVFKGIMK